MPTAYRSVDFIIAFIALAIIPLMSAWTGRSLALSSVADRTLVPRYVWVIVRSVVLILLIGAAWLRLARSFAMLGLDIPVSVWGRVGFAIDAVVASYYAYAILLRRRSERELDAVRERLRRMNSDRMLPKTRVEFALFPVVAVAGSIAEELLYRGFLIWFFSPILGLIGAVLASSFAFSLGHAYLGWRGVVRTAVIGLAFATAFAITHSLWWLMIAHITANMSGLPLQRRLQAVVEPRTA